VQNVQFPRRFEHAHPPVRKVNERNPYPFILMNLFLSLQAACTAPMLMMSQNRLAARDRLEAHNDDEINRKAEEEVRAVHDHLSAQDEALTKIVETLAVRLNGAAQG
jgi:uncharacterized membrane protein